MCNNRATSGGRHGRQLAPLPPQGARIQQAGLRLNNQRFKRRYKSTPASSSASSAGSSPAQLVQCDAFVRPAPARSHPAGSGAPAG